MLLLSPLEPDFRRHHEVTYNKEEQDDPNEVGVTLALCGFGDLSTTGGRAAVLAGSIIVVIRTPAVWVLMGRVAVVVMVFAGGTIVMPTV